MTANGTEKVDRDYLSRLASGFLAEGVPVEAVIASIDPDNDERTDVTIVIRDLGALSLERLYDMAIAMAARGVVPRLPWGARLGFVSMEDRRASALIDYAKQSHADFAEVCSTHWQGCFFVKAIILLSRASGRAAA
jgi:hypothetical protein